MLITVLKALNLWAKSVVTGHRCSTSTKTIYSLLWLQRRKKSHEMWWTSIWPFRWRERNPYGTEAFLCVRRKAESLDRHCFGWNGALCYGRQDKMVPVCCMLGSWLKKKLESQHVKIAFLDLMYKLILMDNVTIVITLDHIITLYK